VNYIIPHLFAPPPSIPDARFPADLHESAVGLASAAVDHCCGSAARHEDRYRAYNFKKSHCRPRYHLGVV